MEHEVPIELKDFLIFVDICTLSHCHGNTMEAFEDDTPC